MAVGLPAVMMATSVASAGMSIAGGISQAKSIKSQGEYNARLYEQQAAMIQEKKRIQEYQFNRQAARMRGAVVARAGKAGLNMSGSPLEVLIDNETQMQYDNAIQNYNLDIERHYSLSAAAETRRQAGQMANAARMRGFSSAFSTMLGVAGSGMFGGTPTYRGMGA